MEESLFLSFSDHQKISNLVAHTSTEVAALLQEELDRAQVLDDEALPQDVVRMNSKVTFEDLESGKVSEVTLVYPQEIQGEGQRLSILAPVGAALIGLRVGQEIEWPLPSGKIKALKVVAVRSET